MMTKHRALVLAAAIAVLLLVVLAVASCGGTTTTGNGTSTGTGSSNTTSGPMTGNAQIDSFLKQMDKQMNSANPNDFDESQLSDKQLGY